MRAHLVLKPITGLAKDPQALPTSENIQQFLAPPELVEAVARTATNLGFQVVYTTPFQITIEGERDSFEKAFGAKLLTPLRGKTVGGSREKRSARKSRSGHAKSLSWKSPPKIPPALTDTVQEVVLPQPLELHGSA